VEASGELQGELAGEGPGKIIGKVRVVQRIRTKRGVWGEGFGKGTELGSKVLHGFS